MAAVIHRRRSFAKADSDVWITVVKQGSTVPVIFAICCILLYKQHICNHRKNKRPYENCIFSLLLYSIWYVFKAFFCILCNSDNKKICFLFAEIETGQACQNNKQDAMFADLEYC